MSMQTLARVRRAPVAMLIAVFVVITGLVATSGDAAAKIPGQTHCYFGICHRVKTLDETRKLVGSTNVVKASYYDDCKVDRFNPCTLTSSGEIFKPHKPDNAASPIYPDGTKLLLWNPKTKAAAIVRVNSAGPYHGKRTLDVSRATAEKLGFKRSGVAQLQVQVLYAPTPAETRYKKHRVYDAVPGPIGTYDNLQLASLDTQRLMPTTVPPVLVADATPNSKGVVAMETAKLASLKSLAPHVKINSRPLDNAKAVNNASRSATVAVMASTAGLPGSTMSMSASAAWVNAVPHALLPAGVLTDRPHRKGRGRTVLASASR